MNYKLLALSRYQGKDGIAAKNLNFEIGEPQVQILTLSFDLAE